jgi:nitrogen fixation protein FixH
MSNHDLSFGEARGRPLTGWTALWIAIACFGVVFAVNGLMAYYAISTFRGDADPSPYEHGLAYDKDIAAAKAQAALGWQVSEHFARDAEGEATIEVRMLDASGAPVAGLDVKTSFDSPADAKLDQSVALTETAAGVYSGRLKAGRGQWDVDLEAARDGARVFKSINRVALE